jgi:hypothetical protein
MMRVTDWFRKQFYTIFRRTLRPANSLVRRLVTALGGTDILTNNLRNEETCCPIISRLALNQASKLPVRHRAVPSMKFI